MEPSADTPTPSSVHRSFVVQLAAGTNFTLEQLAGRVEHIASGQAIQFHSPEELLTFMARYLDEASDQHGNNDA